MNPKILVIIPAFNAAAYLPELIAHIRRFFAPEDILVVNDGSSDETPRMLDRLECRSHAFPQNRGKGAALRAGFEIAVNEDYDAVITIDADLQHPPDRLPDFVKFYEEADILIGTRDIDLKLMPFDRMLTNNLTSIIISIMGNERVRDSQSGYRLIKTAVLRKLRLNSVRYDTESEILFQTGYLGCSVGEVPIDTVYEGSRSFINPLVDTLRFIRQIWKRLWY
jgi:glycosyltransferase involved in cell wall biosynthesis